MSIYIFVYIRSWCNQNLVGQDINLGADVNLRPASLVSEEVYVTWRDLTWWVITNVTRDNNVWRMAYQCSVHGVEWGFMSCHGESWIWIKWPSTACTQHKDTIIISYYMNFYLWLFISLSIYLLIYLIYWSILGLAYPLSDESIRGGMCSHISCWQDSTLRVLFCPVQSCLVLI